MMRGLLMFHQWRDECIERTDFLFGKCNTGSGLREKMSVFFVSIYCKIKVLFKGTGKTVQTGVADIRRSGELMTELLLEVVAESVAQGATFAELVSAVSMAGRADAGLKTGNTERAGVKARIFTACSLRN
jgi:hypothetical protein